jgi:potassium-dependent mechanosensitive channel
MPRIPLKSIAFRFFAVLALMTLATAECAFAAEPKQAPAAATAQAGGKAAPAAKQPESAPAPAPAPPQRPAANFTEAARETGIDINAKMTSWDTDLDRIEADLDAKSLRYRDLDRHRARLDEIRADIDGFLDNVRPRVDSFKAQVDSLGAAPGKDQPAEPEAVATQREEWNATLGNLTVARNAAEAARLRSTQLTGKVQDIRRRRFTERLFERVPEAYAPKTWTDAPGQIVYALQQAGGAVANWWLLQDQPGDVNLVLVIAVLLAIALAFLSRRGISTVRVWKGQEPPPFWRRGAGAAWMILLRALPIAAPVIVLYFGLHGQDLLPADVDRLAYSALRSTLIITVVVALVTTALAPRHPEWRLIPASDGAAFRIRWLVVALAAVYALNMFLGTVRSVAFAPFSVTVVQSFVASVIIALLTMAILRTPLQTPTAGIDGAPELRWLRMLRVPIWGVAILILLAAAAGYLSLARFMSAQLIVTGTILAIVYLLMIWIDAFGQSMSDPEAATGRWLMATFRCEQRRCEQIALPATLILKLAVLLCSVPLILLQWGFDWKDISEWSRDLFVGFRIGNTQISIAAILASTMVFALGYFAARLFQGWLDKQVLEPAGFSGSVRHSIRTGVGYIGVIVAALIAISYAGLDLSSLAIVAGALSVGIGLGLQGVVNNFVSGLILLVERPIKVGDHVEVGGEEGLVRKISVRSTEIETFDRANVLVPNSYFISETVKNWTLHNYSRRIIIPVNVCYGSDPRRTREILLQVARAHSQVMNNPEPFVQLDEFGPQALVFKLYAYVYDLTKGGTVRTDLRIAILEAFKEAGIAMPDGATDISLRNIEKLARALQPQASTSLRDRRRKREEARASSNGNGRAGTTEH